VADVTDQTRRTSAPAKGAKNPHRPDAATTMEIRDPDAFQDTILGGWSWVEKNAVLVGGVLALGLIVLVGYTVMNWWGSKKELKAQEAYFAVESKYTKLKDGFDRAKLKSAMPAAMPKDDKSEDKASSGDVTKDYGTTITDLEKVAHDYAGTAAGTQAAILAADTYLSYGQADKAVAIAEVPAKQMSEKTLLGSLSRIQLGSALATKGDCKEAVKVWGQVIDNKAAPYLHADASLRSGLCYEQMNEPQKALEMYQKVSSESGADSSSSSTAKGLMRALELKTKPAAPAKQG
jgi:predicted negative regulator of RcsB-dependent stress response